MKAAPAMSPDSILIVCLSGRGDKDMHSVADMLSGGQKQ